MIWCIYVYILGTILWILRHHIPLTNLSLPRALPDLDGDGVSELVSACAVVLPSGVADGSAHPHPRTDLVLVSGASGRVLGRPYLMEVCRDIAAVNVTARGEIRIDCETEQGGRRC